MVCKQTFKGHFLLADIYSRILKFKDKSVTIKLIVKILFGIGLWYHKADNFQSYMAELRDTQEHALPYLQQYISLEERGSTGEYPEMLELLEDLAEQLEICTNKEFFQLKKEHQLDSEEEESETPAEM